MIPVFIPSRSRADAKLLEVGPMAYLTAGWHVAYVVPHDQIEDYRALGFPAVARPPEIQGVAMARHWIGNYAKELGCDKFIMFDDDLRFATRVSDYDTKLRPSTTEDMVEMLNAVEHHLEHYGQIGISARTGNNRSGEGAKPLIRESTRTNGCTAYQTEVFLSAEHNRIPLMEDFDVTLQLLRRGIPNACFNYWTYDQAQTNAPGGCSTYRTQELQTQSAERLAELHPGFVRTRQKQNKTGGEFGVRTDVTVYWKKAFESSGKQLTTALKPANPVAPPPPPPQKD